MLAAKFESLIFKLCILVIVFVFLKILFFYLWNKIRSKGVRNTRRYKDNKSIMMAKGKINTDSKMEVDYTLDSDIANRSLVSEVEQTAHILELKQQAKELFSKSIQNKKLNKAEVLDIKEYLISNVEDPNQKDKRYKNDAHCIYSLLKCNYITENTLKKVIDFIFTSASRKIS